MNNAILPASHFCPFIGLKDDADSLVAFPSNSNYCHRCQPIGAVRFNHQEEFCLVKEYNECPVFLREEAQPLPEELRMHSARTHTPQGNLFRNLLIAVGVLAIVAMLGWVFINQPRGAAQGVPTSRQTTLPASSTPTFTNLLVSDVTQSPTASPAIATGTPTLHIPLFASVTATFAPTATPSITPIPFLSRHRLDTPIGTDRQFIIHRLEKGESLDPYVLKYNTSIEAVKAINYYLFLANPVKWDVVVAFPLNFTDVSGLHVLKIYQIPEVKYGVNRGKVVLSFRGLNYEDFVLYLRDHIDLDDFKYYNGITEPDDRPMVGDYFLIPQKRLVP